MLDCEKRISSVQMRRLDFITPRQICNRAREFQDAIMSTREEIELRHCRTHQTLTVSKLVLMLLITRLSAECAPNHLWQRPSLVPLSPL